MNVARDSVSSRIEDLRRAFDQAFAGQPPERVRGERLIAVRVAGDAYALRAQDVVEIAAGRRIVPLPAQTAGLLGLAGIRGGLLPVYSLATLLGYSARETGREAQWLVVCGTANRIALVVDAVEGYHDVPRSEFCPAPDAARQHVREAARAGAMLRPVVSIPSVLEALGRERGPRGRASIEERQP